LATPRARGPCATFAALAAPDAKPSITMTPWLRWSKLAAPKPISIVLTTAVPTIAASLPFAYRKPGSVCRITKAFRWSGRRESNPQLLLGRQGHYHYATPALGRRNSTTTWAWFAAAPRPPAASRAPRPAALEPRPAEPATPRPFACRASRCAVRPAIYQRRRPLRRSSEPLPSASHGAEKGSDRPSGNGWAAADLVGRVGFEPTYRVSGPGLQPGAFNHSTTYPRWRLA
jgi:hypothetical protein